MIKVNAIGDVCPIPVVKTKKAMQELDGAGVIEVLVDNEIAVQNVSKMAASAGAKVASEQVADKEYKITIAVDESSCTCDMCEEENMVIVISSDRMGNGNDDLGKVLIKGFIFAITQLDKMPKTMLFYNGGATLTAEGSDSLEDLKKLEEQGVEILTCGTCLNYYGLSDKLQVGSVSNMYAIVEKM
ncbi:MAG: sulfurtransferase-like selenium metabolism protein YedF, partial [Lachnospiraceae bacterium]|nr:sulfurtransferase-like selenium metabolism protein YedF [Lachnospiraceae bacterium]